MVVRPLVLLAAAALLAGCVDEVVETHTSGAWVFYVDAEPTGGAAYVVPADDDVGPDPDAGPPSDGHGGGGVPDDAGPEPDVPDQTLDVPDVPPDDPCTGDVVCVELAAGQPWSHIGDTATSPLSTLDTYSCAPEVDESGPEVVYRVTVPTGGFLSAAVYDDGGTDVDVHILSAPSADACLDRGHRHARTDVAGPGVWWVVVDTWVDPDAGALAGPYELQLGLYVPSAGPCEVQVGEMPRVGDGGDHLAMPATGPIVYEAHLVTDQEPPPYPSTSTEELEDHYVLSQATTSFVMHRTNVWAPLEGGDFYGAGIGSPTLFPVVDESWYVNMYWTKDARPDRGTRMILRQPGTSRAVVVSAGHETGPGNLANIGGTPEETHYYLGTSHLTVLQLGIATDQALPFGPRTCD